MKSAWNKSLTFCIALLAFSSCSQKQFSFRQKLKADKKPPVTAQARVDENRETSKEIQHDQEVYTDTLVVPKSDPMLEQSTNSASAIPYQKEDLVPFHSEQLSPDAPEKLPEKSSSLPHLKLEWIIATIAFILLLSCPALLIVMVITQAYVLGTLAVILGLTGVLWWLIALIRGLKGSRLLTAGVIIAASLVVLLFIVSITWGLLFAMQH